MKQSDSDVSKSGFGESLDGVQKWPPEKCKIAVLTPEQCEGVFVVEQSIEKEKVITNE